MTTEIRKSRGRSLTDFLPLHPAEKTLLTAAAAGERAEINAQRPLVKTDENVVRAEFIRFLALGGDATVQVHDSRLEICGASITGTLYLVGEQLGITLCLDACYFDKTPILQGLCLEGSLLLRNCLLPGLQADNLSCAMDLSLQGSRLRGPVRLTGAKIGGSLLCRKTLLEAVGEDAINLDRAQIGGSIFFTEGFHSRGRIRMMGAQIEGLLSIKRATLENAVEEALILDRALIRGAVLMNEGVSVRGVVRMTGAEVGGDLSLRSSNLDGNGEDALLMDRVVIRGNAFLQDGFYARGRVRMMAAEVAGVMSFKGASLDGRGREALNMEGSQIKSHLFFEEGFRAQGGLRLAQIQVEGRLVLRVRKPGKPWLGDAKPADSHAVSELAPVADPKSSANAWKPVDDINLMGATVGTLIDDPSFWGEGLSLDGFSYRLLGEAAAGDAKSRIAWLKKQKAEHLGRSSLRPQPWRQVERVLRQMGEDAEANRVAIAFEDLRYEVDRVGLVATDKGWLRGPIRFFSRLSHRLFKGVMNYGYGVERLLMWLVVVWFVCGGLYWLGALSGAMMPTEALLSNRLQRDPQLLSECRENWYQCQAINEYTAFSPWAYSMDLILPMLDLHQNRRWGPRLPPPQTPWYRDLFSLSWGEVLRLIIWMEAIFGWLAGLLLVAVVSGWVRGDSRRDRF